MRQYRTPSFHLTGYLPTFHAVEDRAANAITVRRLPAPRVGRGTRVGSGRAPTHVLDRGDALLYVAERASLPGRRAMVEGRRLLGPWLAFAPLVELLQGHHESAVRGAALGALLLLDATEALDRELDWRQAHAHALSRPDAVDAHEMSWWRATGRRTL